MSDTKPYISVPTRESDGTWTYTVFQTRDDLRDYVKSLFNETEPDYTFDETSLFFNEHARRFDKTSSYTIAPRGTIDYRTFWKTEKEKCKKGVIFKSTNGRQWYLPRYYYHWLNFLQITDKESKRVFFPNIMDVQYHMALYEILAELYYKHAIILKKRQIASSYFHMARMFNHYVFDVGFVGKIGASDATYVNDEGSWSYLSEYRNFNNEHTGWYRPSSPDKPMHWKQQQEITTPDGKKLLKGTKAKITGHTFDKKPTAGLGGPCFEFFYEEAGQAITLDRTYGYMKPAMEFGMLTTGIFIAAGSVGELKDAKPMYNFLTNPDANGFYSIENNLMDKNGTISRTGLFIPEQWGMPPCMDQYGNSQIQRALEMLNTKFLQSEKLMDPSLYQLEISQHPRNVEEAFAIRTVSIFPVRYTSKQIKRIESGDYLIEYGDLEYNDKQELVFRDSDRRPIDEYPISMKTQDKRGVFCVYQRPVRDKSGKIEHRMYMAGIDPVEGGKSTTSESLASIYIYKNAVEVIRTDAEGKSTVQVEPGQIVAWWCGRYDDSNDTNEQLKKIIEWYNAWTIVENNKPGFITYMIANKQQWRLAGKDDMLFIKDLGLEQKTYNPYGFNNSGTVIWKSMLEYGINFLSEKLDEKRRPDGTIAEVVYGVTRIPDIMLLKEMQQYTEKGNFDRIVSFCALIAFVQVQEAAMGKRKKTEISDDPIAHNKQLYRNLDNRQMFHNIGGQGSASSSGWDRNPLRNIK